MCEGENWSSPFRINVRAGWLGSQRGSSSSSIRRRRRSSSCKGNRFGSSAKSLYICEKNRVCRDCKAKPFSQCPMKSNQVILFPGGFSLGSHTGHCACFVADRTEDTANRVCIMDVPTCGHSWKSEWMNESRRKQEWYSGLCFAQLLVLLRGRRSSPGKKFVSLYFGWKKSIRVCVIRWLIIQDYTHWAHWSLSTFNSPP